MITQIDRTVTKLLNDDLEVALQSVADKHGVSARVVSARYTEEHVTFKVEVAVKNAEGIQTRNAQLYKLYANSFGLKPEWLGEQFKHGRDFYTITGLNPRAPKFAVLAENAVTGKQYKFPTDTVIRSMSRE